MKLEVKHITPYLPFKLKCYEPRFNEKHTILGLIKNEIYIGDEDSINSFVLDDETFPILRPLSDLTKEIEVNGEKFVPMEMLLSEHLTVYTKHTISKCKYSVVEIFHETYKYIGGNHYNIKYIEPGDSSIKQLTYDDTFFRFTLRETNPVNRFLGMSYRNLDNMLLEWHFDVFGLIDKGLAVDINTLQNP